MNLKLANTALAMILFCSLCFGASGEAVSIPMRLNEAHQYFIHARINGSDPMWCNVDSGGGDRLYLDRDRAAKMGIQPTSIGRSAGPSDAKMTQDSRSQVTVEISGVKLVNQTVLLQSRPYDDFSCVIGQTIFRQYIVEVDYEVPAIRLHNLEEFRYNGPGKVIPFILEGGSPFVTATLTTPNGKSFEARIAVDTGGGFPLVLLSKTYIDKNDLMNQGLSPTPDPRFGSSGQQARVVSAAAEKFSVGPFDISHPTVHLWQVQGFGGAGGPDGLLCGDFLRRFKLIFDYQKQRIILEPNAHYRD